MNVAIIGPNLYDQSNGTFHVHAATCRDGYNARKYPAGARWEVEASSQVEVSTLVYEDVIVSDHGLDLDSPEALDMAEEYLTDFYFHARFTVLVATTPRSSVSFRCKMV